jgi:hypothetical protein
VVVVVVVVVVVMMMVRVMVVVVVVVVKTIQIPASNSRDRLNFARCSARRSIIERRELIPNERYTWHRQTL